MLATQIDREHDLCTSSEIPADLQNKGVCFYHTLWDSYGKMENTTSLDLGVPPFNHRRILCTKILNQLKMFEKEKKKKALIFRVRLDDYYFGFWDFVQKVHQGKGLVIPGRAFYHFGKNNGVASVR